MSGFSAVGQSRPSDASLVPEDATGVGDGDSDDDELLQSKGPSNTSEKRSAQNARFKQWMLEKAAAEIKEQAKNAEVSADDEELSIRELLARQESVPIIKDPRDYQLELFERAKCENTIAVLDTGSGKTLIAVLLLRHVIDVELEDRRSGRAPRIAFFLVPSVNLVFQQAAVLETNLDHGISRVCGAMNCDLWTQKEWQTHFDNSKVIVCTAEVLHQCLVHSFVCMAQINLLVFDEAHHAKKNNPIIKHYYLKADIGARPRIFGMTASPVDANVDPVQAADDLEKLLHSRIATTADMSLLQKSFNRPDEEVHRYPRLIIPPETPLCSTIKSRFGDLHDIVPMLEQSNQVRSQLGPWCSDLFWKITLSESKELKAESRVQRSFRKRIPGDGIEAMDSEVSHFEAVINVISKYKLALPKADTFNFSGKVLELHRHLDLYFRGPSEHRCIVFVEQRMTARLLCKVFELIGGSHLRPGALFGSGSQKLADLTVSFREQVMTLIKFRNGDLNCLFATAVAEEGLDVPDCNLVIRFDPCQTMIKYVQSRGRARHKHSKFVHMVEAGSSEQANLLRENQKAEQLMRRFCEALPGDRYLMGNNDMPSSSLGINESLKAYVVESTGAKITYAASMAILAHFVALLPKDGEEILQPSYVVYPEAGQFRCEVNLPSQSPIGGAMGDICSKKALARCSAAFNACVELRQRRYLDENLLPVYKKVLPAMRNAALALNMKKKGKYVMRIKPSIWQQSSCLLPSKLFLLLIDVPGGLDHMHQPLILLSRQPLPEFPEFQLHLTSGRQRTVVTKATKDAITVSEEVVHKLTVLTLRIFKDVFNKTYESAETASSKMPYWLAPAKMKGTHQCIDSTATSDLIDWVAVDVVEAQTEYRWDPKMDPASLENRFLIDTGDGGRRFLTRRLAPEYTAQDKVPANTVPGKHNGSILDYSVSLYKNLRQKMTWNPQQPVVEAEVMLHRLNLLAKPNERETKLPTRCFVCPEPLIISLLSPAFVASCRVFPAVIHRLDSYMIGAEICEKLGLNIRLDLALEAITKDSDNTEDQQDQARINFQRGMGNNYERLEFLGDCFLKMATSISVFIQYPNDNEFDFHVKRMLMLCNKNLLRVATHLELYEYIRSQSFSRRTWYPEGLKLMQGKGSNKTGEDIITHNLGDKTIADVSEALMGAAFLSHDSTRGWTAESWNNAVKAVTVLVGNKDHTMRRWTDYSRSYDRPAYQVAEPSASQIDLAGKVEKEHAYSFKYPRLLRSAFLHPSYPSSWEMVPSYQRLEFLGDSLLDMACVIHLIYRYPDKDPQWLTEHKTAMVANRFLGALCVKLGFYRHLRYHTSTLDVQIREYVAEVSEAERTANGALDYWTTVKEPPKCLPDIVEAYIGAMFIDSDFDYGQVDRFFTMHIKPYFEDMSIYDTFATHHPVTRIHHLLADNYGCHEYRLMADEIPSGDGNQGQVIAGLLVHNEVTAGAYSKSTRYAKIRAAKTALEELDGLAPYEFRRRFGCDCDTKGIDDLAERIGQGDSAI